jgi:cation diffusion facilitator family transporter
MLALTGAGIGYSGLKTIMHGTQTLKAPGLLALVAAVISIIVKEAMFWYTKKGAEKINSGALLADAWHHRSDALSSVGSLLGIAAARLGYPIFDPLAAILICFFIFKAAFDIFMDAVDKMVDKAVDDDTINEMRELILAQDGVMAIDDIRTRMFGSRYYVDVEISADASLNLYEAHKIAHKVHDEIETHFKEAKHVMVHVNPEKKKKNSGHIA